MPTEQEQFLKDLEPKEEENLLDRPLEEIKVEEEVEEKPEEDEMKLRNRREKRLSEKLQAERESSIRLAERLATITEAQKFKEDVGEDYLSGVDRIYGTNTPEAQTATELLKNALKGVGKKAKEDALAEFREEQRQAQESVKNEEKALDSMIEEIEDESGVVLTETQKKGFFSMLERMSPKDAEGNVIHYADPNAVWDMYQSKSVKTDNRAKDLSSRSMVQSGASKDTKISDDVNERWLRENGII